MNIFVCFINNFQHTFHIIELFPFVLILIMLYLFILFFKISKILAESVIILEWIFLIVILIEKKVVDCCLADFRFVNWIAYHFILSMLNNFNVISLIIHFLFQLIKFDSVYILFFYLVCWFCINSIQIVDASQHLSTDVQVGNLINCILINSYRWNSWNHALLV